MTCFSHGWHFNLCFILNFVFLFRGLADFVRVCAPCLKTVVLQNCAVEICCYYAFFFYYYYFQRYNEFFCVKTPMCGACFVQLSFNGFFHVCEHCGLQRDALFKKLFIEYPFQGNMFRASRGWFMQLGSCWNWSYDTVLARICLPSVLVV